MCKGNKIRILKDICTPMFIAALFTTGKLYKQPKNSLMNEQVRKCGICNEWNIIWPQERRKSCYLQLHGWTLRTLAKRSKSYRKIQILYCLTYTCMWNLKEPNSLKQSKMMIAKGCRVGEMGDIGQRVETSSYKTNMFGGI